MLLFVLPIIAFLNWYDKTFKLTKFYTLSELNLKVFLNNLYLATENNSKNQYT
jgi:hypothetical protein